MKCIFDTRRLRLWPIHWYEISTWLRFDTSLNGYRFDRIRQILGIKSKHKHQYKQQKLNIWPNNEKPQFYTCLFSFRFVHLSLHVIKTIQKRRYCISRRNLILILWFGFFFLDICVFWLRNDVGINDVHTAHTCVCECWTNGSKFT